MRYLGSDFDVCDVRAHFYNNAGKVYAGDESSFGSSHFDAFGVCGILGARMDFDDDLLRVLNFRTRDGGEFDCSVGLYDHCLHLGRNCHCQGKEVRSRELNRIAGRLRLERMLKGTRHSHCVTSFPNAIGSSANRNSCLFIDQSAPNFCAKLLRRADRKKLLHS